MIPDNTQPSRLSITTELILAPNSRSEVSWKHDGVCVPFKWIAM